MMATNGDFDRSISSWLEETAPTRLPERVLESTFELTRTTRQRVDWRGLLGRSPVARPALALGGAAIAVMAVVVTMSVVRDRPGLGAPQPTVDAFLGTWISTSDSDGGTQTMTVRASADGGVEIVVTDTVASVCARTPSTMTGTGRLDGSARLVIAAPVYRCDDGSEPKALSGPPLEDQLRNLTYVYDRASDTLTVGAGSASVWRRPGAALATAAPTNPDTWSWNDPQSWDPSRFPGTWVSTPSDTGIVGTWGSTDVDGSSLTLGIRVAEAVPDIYEVLLRDDRAGGGRRRWPESDWPGPLCATDAGIAGPIMMVGTGRIDGLALALDGQSWFCESRPDFVTGDHSVDLKQAYAPLVHDPETDTLVGPAGVVWYRRPPGSDPLAVPFWGAWPQTTRSAAEEAQRLADAGDPAAAWQLAPELATPPNSETFSPSGLIAADAADAAKILDRFFRDVLGWDRYMTVSRRSPADSGQVGWEFVRIRCGAETNPLYPNDGTGGNCSPTIGDTDYETVSVSVVQTVHGGPAGIWEVTGWTKYDPATDEPGSDLRHRDMVDWQFKQAVPPTKAAVIDALEAFLSARVAGQGAEPYLTEGYIEDHPTVPLLYATTKGDRYDRFEIVDVQSEPDWPEGSRGVTVRLFARGGKDVVEQQFQVWPGSHGQLTMDTMMTTTENGVEVPDPIGSE